MSIEKNHRKKGFWWIKYIGIICFLFLAVFISPTSAESINVVTNPGFESGTSPWVFYTNGGGLLLKTLESPYAGIVKISTAGTNVQLFQSGIVLEPNTEYKLSFKAYSNTGHDVTVSLIKHGSPYTIYGLSNFVVNLGTTWGSYSKQFTTSGFSGTVNDARIMFSMAPYDASGDQYVFDDVILTKVSPSIIPPPTITPSPSPYPTPIPPPTSNNQLILLDVTHTHNTAVSSIPVPGSGKAFSFFNFPSWMPNNLVSPNNFAQGTLYQRLKVMTKPSSKPVRYQICLFQDQIIPSKHACSTNSLLTFTGPGTYYANQPMSTLYQYSKITWTRPLLIEMLVVADGNGKPVDDRYGWLGQWSGSPNFNLYYPMQVRYTAIIVKSGGGAPVWPS
ncbi:MAG TPA: carbohydrate binding domain-containing protein [candidate division Zixibacteria bacterium]|nr:carbohydrate binding domain-containing protein [candidate division Zixibacteria bacterium]